jgi:ABC-type transporter Mla maintaining outer membrane lipid asymmetry permease subunit MlaE
VAILPAAPAAAAADREQVYNTGARSLVIIMTCGLFVGMVLGLQGLRPAAALRLRGIARHRPASAC